jgi:hypothetical protein
MQTTIVLICDRKTGLPKRKESWSAKDSLEKDANNPKAKRHSNRDFHLKKA